MGVVVHIVQRPVIYRGTASAFYVIMCAASSFNVTDNLQWCIKVYQIQGETTMILCIFMCEVM